MLVFSSGEKSKKGRFSLRTHSCALATTASYIWQRLPSGRTPKPPASSSPGALQLGSGCLQGHNPAPAGRRAIPRSAAALRRAKKPKKHSQLLAGVTVRRLQLYFSSSFQLPKGKLPRFLWCYLAADLCIYAQKHCYADGAIYNIPDKPQSLKSSGSYGIEP